MRIFGKSQTPPTVASVASQPVVDLSYQSKLQRENKDLKKENEELKAEIASLKADAAGMFDHINNEMTDLHTGLFGTSGKVKGSFRTSLGHFNHIEGDVSGLFGNATGMFDQRQKTKATLLTVGNFTIPPGMDSDCYDTHLGRSPEDLEEEFLEVVSARVQKLNDELGLNFSYPPKPVEKPEPLPEYTEEDSNLMLALAYQRLGEAFDMIDGAPVLLSVIKSREVAGSDKIIGFCSGDSDVADTAVA